MTDISSLNILLHGKKVGTLSLLPGDRSIFSFDDAYVADKSRDTLSLSFKNPLGELLTRFDATGPNLLPFFSNLLPEGTLRDYLARQAGVKPVRELYLLWALGQDLPGAVTVLPDDGEGLPDDDDETTAEEKATRKEQALRFSLAGVQLKFSALRNAGKNGGLTIPAKGIGGEWIVKLPADRFEGVPENEFSFMTIARQIGIDVPEIELIDLKSIDGLPDGLGRLRGEKAFAIKRFDRSDDGPVHIEDFAQVFGRYPFQKYDQASYRNIATVLGIETTQGDVAEYIRRLVYSTLIGNDDMHLKNWSLIYYDRKTPSVAPAYDLLATIPYLPSKTAAMKYVTTNVMAELTLKELAVLASKAKLPEKLVLDTAKETVAAFQEVWAKEKTNLALSEDVIKAVDAHLATLILPLEC
ncbi:type II toxin-antitoxin system HipA family toxin [Pannonibacter carbonis]|uniref:type II toxin-antitoxin system HipA family toxin n=1 Tax=Pannonibacter carbonis TaxID=2067569 RepID=UPI000D0E3C32|nr:HipA domain-containing protein [Pannonibacter carbonis]